MNNKFKKGDLLWFHKYKGGDVCFAAKVLNIEINPSAFYPVICMIENAQDDESFFYANQDGHVRTGGYIEIRETATEVHPSLAYPSGSTSGGGSINFETHNPNLNQINSKWIGGVPPKFITSEAKRDMVNHPPHYTSHPSGVECITITRHMTFNIGNVVKYLWRCDGKGAPIEDLEKAEFYLKDEIKRRKLEK